MCPRQALHFQQQVLQVLTVDAGLADEIVDLASQERRTLETRMQDRYLTLRWFIISVISLSLVITAYVLTGAMRATRT